MFEYKAVSLFEFEISVFLWKKHIFNEQNLHFTAKHYNLHLLIIQGRDYKPFYGSHSYCSLVS